ncbi:MAG: hypothetical protein NVS2B12_33610 [Ktedonobacteraceae bacterium]
MAKRWDNTLKNLMGTAPQDFVGWIKEGTRFDAELSPHLGSRNIDADLLYRVHYARNYCLFHIEFQKLSNTTMPRRLWEYNTLAALKYKLPVYSIVIYLKKSRPIIESPYIQTLPWGEEVQRFTYRVIKLWEVPTETILDSGFEGLLPLVPLTAQGLRREAIEQVITRLNPVDGAPKVDQLSLTYILASLEYTDTSDLRWLKRRFAMIDDILRESWVFKEWRQEAEEQVTEQVLKQSIVTVVQARFASLTALAQERIEPLKTSQDLHELLIQVARAQDEEEVRSILLALGDRQ